MDEVNRSGKKGIFIRSRNSHRPRIPDAGKRSEEPSKFVKGWIEAFDNMSWAEMASKLDNYYESNPDKGNRLVFDVLWHEMIKPNLKN